MPHQITNPSEILSAIERTALLVAVPEDVRHDWLRGFVDSSNGKSSGPLIRLISYEVGETLIRENEWGGNTFMVLVSGRLEVFMQDPNTGIDQKANEILPGESFGEMSLFAGVPRNASVIAVGPTRSFVLEIERQAFRGIEKKAKGFIEQLSQIYQIRGLSTAIERLRQSSPGSLTELQLELLRQTCTFRVFGRSHVLCEKGAPIDKAYLLIEGWIRRTRDLAHLSDSDFLGGGHLLGIEALGATSLVTWPYTSTIMLRTEVMEIDVAAWRANDELSKVTRTMFASFADSGPSPDFDNADDREQLVESTEQLITTGIVEADNVLVMDMDLCIRCGNCSFACHQVHGQSRLIRRGIHIERSPSVAQKNRHILVPEVCINCQDPECLTGCPTGAIARMAGGQIDIEKETCTGCTACARLCPYNAISMVEENRAPELNPGFVSQLGSWLGTTAPALPAPVTGTKKDNVIAVKCNLCAGTPLNPAGTLKLAYSCEENCPTGALVRVNPRDYFSEAEKQQALLFRSPTMAMGRNIHRRDPLWWWSHAIGGLLIVLVLVVEVWAWKHYGFNRRLTSWLPTMRWLTGIAGGVAIAATMFIYSARRRCYTRRVGPLRFWMLGHIYVGAIAAATTMLHGGSHRGGPLTTTLMVLFDLVLLTGLFGVASYYFVPRLLTGIEGEALLLEDLEARREELRKENRRPNTNGKEIEEILSQARRHFESFGYLFRQFWRGEELSALLASARKEYSPKLQRLTVDVDRAVFFEDIERQSTIRRLDALIYLHRILKAWLPLHIIVSILLLAVLLIHVVQAMVFSVR